VFLYHLQVVCIAGQWPLTNSWIGGQNACLRSWKYILHTHFGRRASEVGLVTLLRAGQSRILIPAAERKDFSVLKNIQKDPGVHSSSNLNGTRSSFPGNEAAVAWDRSLNSSVAEVKNWYCKTSTIPLLHSLYMWNSSLPYSFPSWWWKQQICLEH